MMQLQWVTEWRITEATESEKKLGYNYRISNDGVYTVAKDLDEAKQILLDNIKGEQYNYIQNFIPCVNCHKTMSQHRGMDAERCLLEYSERKSMEHQE